MFSPTWNVFFTRASIAGMLPALLPVLWKKTPPQGLGSTSPNWSLQPGHWYLNWLFACHGPGRGIGTSRGCCGFVCRTHPSPFIYQGFLKSFKPFICQGFFFNQHPAAPAGFRGSLTGSLLPWRQLKASRTKIQFSYITCSVTSPELYFHSHFSKGWQNLPGHAVSSHYLAQGTRGSSVLVPTSINSN